MGDTSDLKIVLSYRRDDSADVSGRIFDRLVKHFGDDRMFIDIDNIPLGTDFHDHLGHTLENCGALLAVIGKAWSGPRRGRSARIMDEDDWVRLEVEAALARQVPVIPILVGNAELPAREQLPASLIPLRRRQSLSVDSGVDFHQHMNRLIAALERLLDQQRQARAPEPVRSAPSEPVPRPGIPPLSRPQRWSTAPSRSSATCRAA